MNPKQEILDALKQAEEDCYSKSPSGVSLSVNMVVARIRAILETHTLEPIDEREFDPTLCGLKLIYDGDKMKSWGSASHIVRNIDGCITLEARADDKFVPWPATQSDGERLLKLLGVLR